MQNPNPNPDPDPDPNPHPHPRYDNALVEAGRLHAEAIASQEEAAVGLRWRLATLR